MILESIFRGNFSPLDLVVPDDPEYMQLNRQACDLRDRLAKALTPDDVKVLDSMISTMYNAQLMDCVVWFISSLFTGLLIEKRPVKSHEEVIHNDLFTHKNT